MGRGENTYKKEIYTIREAIKRSKRKNNDNESRNTKIINSLY